VTATTSTAPGPRGWSATGCRIAAALLVAVFVASVARFYHRDFGFTVFIGFGPDHQLEIPAVPAVPHFHYGPGSGYDGQFYAQLAVEPLLRDAAIDRALDLPPYRARRILFSWTAYALGLGRPAWILQAYALQNVACWLLLAWILTRWLPVSTVRGLALWTACLWNYGILASVRLALVDGPSMLLIACSVAAVEARRVWSGAAILGVAGLARETNLLAIPALTATARASRLWRRLAVFAAAAAIAIVPLLVWQDYLWSIYRGGTFTRQNQLTVPFTAFLWKWSVSARGALANGPGSPDMVALVATVSLTVQAIYVFAHRQWARPWWRVAAAYALLMLVVHQVVWGGVPGAVTRVVLPLTVGFNILLFSHERRTFWGWFAAGNLQLPFAFAVLRG